MISVDGLTVEFGGTTLFSDISFQINEKDRIALMGKNGAGKSTLLKILAGVRQPSRGKVSALGLYDARSVKLINKKGRLKSSVIIDELPTK